MSFALSLHNYFISIFISFYLSTYISKYNLSKYLYPIPSTLVKGIVTRVKRPKNIIFLIGFICSMHCDLPGPKIFNFINFHPYKQSIKRTKTFIWRLFIYIGCFFTFLKPLQQFKEVAEVFTKIFPPLFHLETFSRTFSKDDIKPIWMFLNPCYLFIRLNFSDFQYGWISNNNGWKVLQRMENQSIFCFYRVPAIRTIRK